MRRRRTRRDFLAALGFGAAGLAVGCGGNPAAVPVAPAPGGGPAVTGPSPGPPGATPTATPPPSPTATATPAATPTPRPPGHEVRALMAGTVWETEVSIRSTGIDGPALMVLGGVHGNEPGGWFAADQVAGWEPAAGVLAVLPRANVLAIAGFLRLIEGEGDLNRQYPGDANSDLPMERLAAQITGLARELSAEVLLDLHESWAHYVDREAAGFENRTQAGTAFLGQTITGGAGPRGREIAGQLADAVNPLLATQRELLVPRDGSPFSRNDSDVPTGTRRRSSLSLGGHVAGLTPVLVEMAQEGQAVERRTEMHLAVVRAAMDLLGI